jgi:hypothetical protein
MEYERGSFYVVYYRGSRTVAKFCGNFWSIVGYDGPIDTEELDEIGKCLDV